MAEKREVKQWITVNGRHVPIFEGESADDAVKRQFNADRKRIENWDDENEKKWEKDWIDESEKAYKKYSKLSKKEIEKLLDDEKFVDNLTDDEYKFLDELWERKNEEEKRGKVQKQISKDLDEKEKQIKQNETERKSKEDIARDKETFRKAREHETRVKTKAQAGKQAVRDAKSAIKQYGPSRGMWKDFDAADKVWTKISKAYASGEISREDYETAYHTFGSRFFEMRKTRHRKK